MSSWSLSPIKSPGELYTYSNIVAVSPLDFNPRKFGQGFYLLINNTFVLSAVPLDTVPPGCIGLSDPQRTWAQISLRDKVFVKMYDPFSENDKGYLQSIELEIGFAGRKTTTEKLDQEDLAKCLVKTFQNQIFAPRQRILMDYKSIPLLLVVHTVSLGDLSMQGSSGFDTVTDIDSRGILLSTTLVSFHKDAKSAINLGLSMRGSSANPILAPSFKFEDLGIGGLGKEFETIFRRTFQSRCAPRGLQQELNIGHVRGMLLYGPPGTGKTMIARKIGQMLNARPPKVVNGPEVLNKFVGQSEENIRNLFADAEKENQEKGEESGLHIIIFDELDAICKRRGSGSSGGTGVGDSIVNQLLTKLDGVNQLNNILVIGMTNRKDMIDEALLRPGRLEVHVPIPLPDEAGRLEILKIHTAIIRKNNRLEPDVDLSEIARRTKNFSGAELDGLVRSATNFALNRHFEGGTTVKASNDIDQTTLKMVDFDRALDEIEPAFGPSGDELLQRISRGGIIHYSPFIGNILEQGSLIVRQVKHDGFVRKYSALLHGPTKSGKTALAAKIALDSGLSFIKLLTPGHLVGMDEMMKVSHIHQIFENSYKSSLSMIIIDDIEKIIGWSDIGPRFQNSVLQALMALLHQEPSNGSRLLCLATTSNRSVVRQLGLSPYFDADIAVPTVNTYAELATVLREASTFQDDQLPRALHELQSRHQGDERIGVGIKTVLTNIGTSQQDDNFPERFAEVMSRCMLESNS